MSRRKLIWHIGLAQSPRPVIESNLHAHRAALAQADVQVVATPREAAVATHELLRTQREAGLTRPEVEGRWAQLCDRVWEHKGVSLLSTPDLCAADKDQLRMALDPLVGIEVHLVVTLDSFSQQLYGGWLGELRSGRTTGWEKYAARVLAPTRQHRQAEQFWAGHDLAAVLGRWGWTLRQDRQHVVADPDPGRQWSHLLDIAGVSAAGLDAVVPAYADPAGVAVLRKVNRQLEAPLQPGSADLLAAVDTDRSVTPVVCTTPLAPTVQAWTEALTEAGNDIRGDLVDLLEAGPPSLLPGHGDQLAVAVDALADALAENSRLRSALADLQAAQKRSEQKRRKLKRRLKQERAALVPGQS